MPLVDIVYRIVWPSVASAGPPCCETGYAVVHMDTAVPNNNHPIAIGLGAARTLTVAVAFGDFPRHHDEKSVCSTDHRPSICERGWCLQYWCWAFSVSWSP